MHSLVFGARTGDDDSGGEPFVDLGDASLEKDAIHLNDRAKDPILE